MTTSLNHTYIAFLWILLSIAGCEPFHFPLVENGWLNHRQHIHTRGHQSMKLHAAGSSQCESNANDSRRSFILSSSLILFHTLNYPNPARGAVTDATSTFANTNSDSSYSPQNLGSLNGPNDVPFSSPTLKDIVSKQSTDEIVVNIPWSKLQSSQLGIELADVEFRTNRRVYVKSIMPLSLAAQLGIQKNWVLVKINGESTERTNAQGAKQIFSQITKIKSGDSLQLVFRDNSFEDQLQNLTLNEEAVTQVAPAGDTTQRKQDGSIRVGSETSQQDQKMIVSQIVPPKMCNRGARIDDLLEISYIGTIVETGQIFDGSAVMVNGKGVPGRFVPKVMLIVTIILCHAYADMCNLYYTTLHM